MVTLKDVAQAAGVSLGTVSNVLNKRDSVKPANVEKVTDAVRRLNYVPNNAARTLKTNVSKSVGLILPDITNPFYPEVARGAEDIAKKNGYSVFLCNVDRDYQKELDYIRILMRNNVDGIILVKPFFDKTSKEIRNINRPFVVVDIGLKYVDGFNIINIDDYNGALSGMQHLFDQGHRRIAFIAGIADCRGGLQRAKAYEDFLASKDIPLNPAYMRRGAYDSKSGRQCMLDLLALEERPTAIFAANDLMAIGAMQAARMQGLSIPEDVSIVGADDIEMAGLCWPRLTTVARPKYQMGAKSMEMLIKCIGAGGDECDASITLTTRLVERESTAPPRNA